MNKNTAIGFFILFLLLFTSHIKSNITHFIKFDKITKYMKERKISELKKITKHLRNLETRLRSISDRTENEIQDFMRQQIQPLKCQIIQLSRKKTRLEQSIDLLRIRLENN